VRGHIRHLADVRAHYAQCLGVPSASACNAGQLAVSLPAAPAAGHFEPPGGGGQLGGRQMADQNSPSVEVFTGANFQGERRTYSQSAAFLEDFNDKMASFKVYRGHWQFYLDSNFKRAIGPVFGPGEYPSIADDLADARGDNVSSIMLVTAD
jgi:hypothetical protein